MCIAPLVEVAVLFRNVTLLLPLNNICKSIAYTAPPELAVFLVNVTTELALNSTVADPAICSTPPLVA